MTNYYLGVDVGATKSHFIIAGSAGNVAGFGAAGPGNPDGVGQDGFGRVLEEGVTAALTNAGLTRSQIQGAGFGVSGYDWPSQRAAMLATINSLGLRCPLGLVNDALIALVAGASAGWGVAVIAGTSCNAWGIGPDGRYGRMAGYSWLGEYAGSHEIVEKALQAIAKAWSCRGPKTALTQAFIELVGASSEADLIEGVALEKYAIRAEAAPVVFRIATEGDRVAEALLHWAGAELGDLALGIIRQLDLSGIPFEVVLSGSFFKGSPLIQREIERVTRRLAPQATFVTLTAPPVIGGALLGMQAAGRPAAEIAAARQRLAKSYEGGGANAA